MSEIQLTPPRGASLVAAQTAELPSVPGRFTITPEQVVSAVEDAPDATRQAVKWATQYCRRKGLSPHDFGAMLRQPGTDKTYSGDSVYQLFTGRREGGSLDRMVEAIEQLRARTEETGARLSFWVNTSISQKITRVLRTAHERHKLSFIISESQVGKTATAEHYAQEHDEVILVRMPTGGALTDLLAEFAVRLDLPPAALAHRKRQIIECFDPHTLLIVDECEEALFGRRLTSLHFIREIYDRRKCGVVMLGAPAFRAAVRTEASLARLWRRGCHVLDLPSLPTQKDLDAFAEAYGLPPAPNVTKRYNIPMDDGSERQIEANPFELQRRVVEQDRLGHWLIILENANDMAKTLGRKVTWAAVIVSAQEFRNDVTNSTN